MQTEHLGLSDVKKNPEKLGAPSLPCLSLNDTFEKEASLIKPPHEELASCPEEDTFFLGRP